MSGPFPILYIAEADGEAAVLSSGVLACLVEQMPRATFTVVGSATSAPLFADTPRLDRLIVVDGEKAFDWLELWPEVRRTVCRSGAAVISLFASITSSCEISGSRCFEPAQAVRPSENRITAGRCHAPMAFLPPEHDSLQV